MNGYLGLTKSINDRAQSERDLSILERMDQRQEQEQAQDLQAQAAQDQMYQRMYEEAGTLLEKDRKRINNRIKMGQRQVQESLDKYGGSESDFLSNGGMNVLSQMENDILRSDEAERFRQNQENLAYIKWAEQQGMGHLISPNDLKSVQDYHANEDGATITYSGMMSEVEIPHEMFSLGDEINPMYIMNHNANMIKILGNYAKMNPDNPEPEMDENGKLTGHGTNQVLAFMKKMGYGGMGKSAAMLQARMKRQDQAKQQKAVQEKRTVLAAMNRLDQMHGKLTIADIDSGYMDKFMNGEGGEASRDLLGDKFHEYSRGRSAAGSDFDFVGETIDYFGQDKLGLRGSRKLAITADDQASMASKILNVEIENNRVKGFDVTNDMYAADGTKISYDERDFDAEDYGTEFKFLGIVSGFKSAVANGTNGSEDVLLVDAYDDDGKLDQESTDKLYQNKFGDAPDTEARQSYFIALKGKDDDIIYKEVRLDQTPVRQAMADAYASNDITDMVEEEKRNDKALAEYQKMTGAEEIAFEEYKNNVQPLFDNNPGFKTEAEAYYGAGSGGQWNRDDLMKSFYMAFEAVGSEMKGQGNEGSGDRMQKHLDKNLFSAFMKRTDMEDDLRDYDKSHDEIIKTFLQRINKGVEAGSLDQKTYQKISAKWMQILNKL